MTDASPPGRLSGLAALRHGRAPPPIAGLERLPAYPWLVVGTVCVGAVMGQVDSSIAQLLLPRLETVFGARLDVVSWVAIAYLLAMAAFLPVFGRLADMVGRKLLYCGGFLLFSLGSGLCGLAPDLPWLIAFRVLQGIGAALLAANSIALIVTAVGPARRGRALGIQAAAQAAGLCIGPALGGLLLDALDWRWVFWINVPLGLVGTLLGWLVLPAAAPLPGDRRFDWAGAIVLVPTLAALLAVINEAHVWGLASPLFLACAAAALGLPVLFVAIERRAPAPLVDFRLFRSGAFAGGNAAALMAYAMLFGLFFLMPFVFVRVYGETALAAGLRLTMVPVALALVAPLSGLLSERLGPHVLTAAGMAVCVVSLALLHAAADGTAEGLPLVMLALAGVGIGQGLFVSPNNASIMAAAPAALTGEAGGLMSVVRACGMSIGIAAASACLSWRIEAATGIGGSTAGVAVERLAGAGAEVVLLLAGFAAAAGAISLAGWRRGGEAAEQPR